MDEQDLEEFKECWRCEEKLVLSDDIAEVWQPTDDTGSHIIHQSCFMWDVDEVA